MLTAFTSLLLCAFILRSVCFIIQIQCLFVTELFHSLTFEVNFTDVILLSRITS